MKTAGRIRSGNPTMMNVVRRWFVMALPACAVAMSPTACRQEPPPPKHNTNLGTADRPLLPTRLPQFDARILTGRADVVPLQDPTAANTAVVPTATDDPGAIRALVERFRTATLAFDFEAVVPMMVERQREVASATASLQRETSELVRQVLEAMPGKTPALHEAAGKALETVMKLEFAVDQLTVDGATASVPMSVAGAPPLQMEKVDGQWYVVLPAAPADKEAAIQTLTAQKQAFQAALDALNDDALSEQDRTQRVGAAFAAMSAGAAPSTPDR